MIEHGADLTEMMPLQDDAVQPEHSAQRGVEGSASHDSGAPAPSTAPLRGDAHGERLPDPEVEVSVERFSALGEGVGMLDGRAVFVPGAFPGEKVRVRLEPSGKVRRAEVVERLTSSPHRRPSACPVSEVCGGCDWLELEEAAQREARLEIVLSTLEHVGGISRGDLEVRPVLEAGAPLGQRRRVVLHPGEGGFGFFARRSHTHVPIERCPALIPELERLPARLTEVLGKEGRKLREVHLLGISSPAHPESARTAAAFYVRGKASLRHRALAERAMEATGLSGVVLVPEESGSELLGDPVLSCPAPCAPGARLHYRPDAFAQADATANAHLVGTALELAQPRQTDRVLELFAGNGNFSLALGRRAGSVLAVESSPVSIGLGQRSTREARADNIRFVLGDAMKVCSGLVREHQTFDLLLADPPRTGARGLGEIASALGVQRVVYVACDAHALARDAAELQGAGYRPLVLQLVDQFPQTRHVEAVLSFSRAA